MDPLIYFLAEYFPWWGVPTALILGEVANHFRRTGQRVRFFFMASLCFLMVVLCVIYFTQSGFKNLRPAMQEMEREYRKK